MGIPHFIYHSSADGHLGCSYFLAVMNNTAMEIYIQDFAWIHVFISFGHIPRSGLAVITLSLIYWMTTKVFYTLAA